jgi:hypothetical protein
MRIQSGVIVPLGYGKYVRSDRVTSVVPIEDERGPGRRTFVYVEEQKEPLVASRAEDSLVRDLVREPREVHAPASSRRYCVICWKISAQ